MLFSKTVKSWVCPSVMAERLTITKNWDQNMYGLFQFSYVTARIRTKWVSISVWDPVRPEPLIPDDSRTSQSGLSIYLNIFSLLSDYFSCTKFQTSVWDVVYNTDTSLSLALYHRRDTSAQLTSLTLHTSDLSLFVSSEPGEETWNDREMSFCCRLWGLLSVLRPGEM